MKRLTEEGFRWDSESIFRDIDRWSLAECLNRLSAYEDTGLTPEEIMYLKERDAEKAPSVKINDEAVKVGAITFGKGTKVYHCPNCKRLIIYGDRYSQGYEDGTDNFYNAVVDIIRKHMNDGWIPVEERLPEDDMPTPKLVTALVPDRKAGWDTSETFSVVVDTDVYDPGYTGKWECYKKNVIAWRPLPDPYRPERSDCNGK